MQIWKPLFEFIYCSWEKDDIDFCVPEDLISDGSEVLIYIFGCEISTFITNINEINVLCVSPAHKRITYDICSTTAILALQNFNFGNSEAFLLLKLLGYFFSDLFNIDISLLANNDDDIITWHSYLADHFKGLQTLS